MIARKQIYIKTYQSKKLKELKDFYLMKSNHEVLDFLLKSHKKRLELENIIKTVHLKTKI